MAGLIAAGLLVRAAPGGASGILGRVGAHGQAAYVLAAALLCAVGMPRQIAAYAAAYAFGLWDGIALALTAQLIGCALDLGWARVLGRDWTRNLMRRRLDGRIARLDGFLRANPFTATLTLRLLPIGSNVVLNLLAGVSSVAIAPFLFASAIGYLPQTVIAALFGSGTIGAASGLAQATQLALGGILFAASVLLGIVLLRRVRATVAAA
jgi:uncharacterized membrane protein YdjX (TVP38/TMEM64 family)